MNRNNPWKWALVVFLVAWSLVEIYPPKGRDLIEEFKKEADPMKRDATFTNIVKTAEALRDKNPERGFGNLREAVGTNDIRKYFSFYDVKAELNPNLAILN